MTSVAYPRDTNPSWFIVAKHFFHLLPPSLRYFLCETRADRRSELNVLIFRRQRRVPAAEPSFDFPLGFLRRLIATQTRTSNAGCLETVLLFLFLFPSLFVSSVVPTFFSSSLFSFQIHVVIISKFLLSFCEFRINFSSHSRVSSNGLLQMFFLALGGLSLPVTCNTQSTNEFLDIFEKERIYSHHNKKQNK